MTNDTRSSAQNLTVSDSVDGSVGTVAFILDSNGAVSDPSVELTSLAPSATEVTYTTSFVAVDGFSSGFSSVGYGTIRLTAPTGTVFSGSKCAFAVYDDNFDVIDSCAKPALTNSDFTATLNLDFTVPRGDLVTVTASGVSNDASTGAQSLGIATSADPVQPSPLPSYTLSSKAKILDPALQLSSHAVGATGVTYVLSFQATDGLTSEQSTVTLAAPAGTVFDAGSGGAVCGTVGIVYTYDDANGASTNCATLTLSNSGAMLTISPDISVTAGDEVTIILEGVTNDGMVGTSELHVSTSSDPKASKVKYTLR